MDLNQSMRFPVFFNPRIRTIPKDSGTIYDFVRDLSHNNADKKSPSIVHPPYK